MPTSWRPHYLGLIRLTHTHGIQCLRGLLGLLYDRRSDLSDRDPLKVCLVHGPPVFFEPREVLSDSLPQIVNPYLLVTLFPRSFDRRCRFFIISISSRSFICVFGLEFLDA